MTDGLPIKQEFIRIASVLLPLQPSAEPGRLERNYFLAAALCAASLKIFFTVESLKAIWLLPEPMNPELGTVGAFGGAFAFVSCFAIYAP